MRPLAAVSEAVARAFSLRVLDPVSAVHGEVGQALVAGLDRRDIVTVDTGGSEQSMERQIT
ncbi:hypothetical protein GCM10022284_10070 [Streptomyces hundungensis]